MPRLLTDALVRALRTHGERRAGPEPDAPRWRGVADASRALALGLYGAGVGPGARARVDAVGLTAVEVVERELALLATGAVLHLAGDHRDVDVVVGPTEVRVGRALAGRPLAALRAEGRAIDRARPDAHERAVVALPADAPAVSDGIRVVTQAEAGAALHVADRWLRPVAGDGPRAALASPAPPPGTELAAALLGRWWPATTGGHTSAPGPDTTSLRRTDPDLVVLGPEGWALLADRVRAAAARTSGGRSLLRTGRALAAGEPVGRAERAAAAVAARRVTPRLRDAAGLATTAVAVALGPVEPVDAVDLASAGTTLVPTWVEPGVPAPIAAGGAEQGSAPPSWLRPLPGRVVEVAGGTTTLHGADLPPGGLRSATPVDVDGRGRVRLRPPRGGADR